MGLGYLTEKGFGNACGVRRFFHKIHIMNGTGRMELRHEERIHIPKFRLHQVATQLLIVFRTTGESLVQNQLAKQMGSPYTYFESRLGREARSDLGTTWHRGGGGEGGRGGLLGEDLGSALGPIPTPG